MKILTLILSILILTISFTADAGKPVKGCGDVPISLTFLAPPTAPAAISNDDPTRAYMNGVEGVDNEVIHISTDCNGGSHDATIKWGNGPKAKRKIQLQFPNVIPDSLIAGQGGPAPFAGGPSFLSFGFMNIRNVTGRTVIDPVYPATYYTRVTFDYITGTDGGSYRLHFYPDDYACPAGQICVPDFTGPHGDSPLKNQPVETEWAKVTFTPRDRTQPWSTSNTDQWIVEGTLTSETDPVIERATLFRSDTNTHYGQYSMPFKILITALAALP